MPRLAENCGLAIDHKWYVDWNSVCVKCGAVACSWCGGEGVIFSNYRDPVEGGGTTGNECNGSGGWIDEDKSPRPS